MRSSAPSLEESLRAIVIALSPLSKETREVAASLFVGLTRNPENVEFERMLKSLLGAGGHEYEHEA